MAKLTVGELVELSVVAEERAVEAFASATEDQVREGLDWYGSANAVAVALADRFGCDVSTAAAVVAALSPRVRWSANVADAEAVMSGELSGFVALGSNIVKAWRILDGEDPDVVLGGRKVRSFWRNIASPRTSLDVTLDMWMLRALVPESHWEHLAGPYNFLGRRAVYDAVADGVRRAAKGLVLDPCQLQAVVWIVARGSAE